VITTGGGDKVVVAQQTSRYILKMFQYFVAGKMNKIPDNSSVRNVISVSLFLLPLSLSLFFLFLSIFHFQL
jgi:hypothetical protein